MNFRDRPSVRPAGQSVRGRCPQPALPPVRPAVYKAAAAVCLTGLSSHRPRPRPRPRLCLGWRLEPFCPELCNLASVLSAAFGSVVLRQTAVLQGGQPSVASVASVVPVVSVARVVRLLRALVSSGNVPRAARSCPLQRMLPRTESLVRWSEAPRVADGG